MQTSITWAAAALAITAGALPATASAQRYGEDYRGVRDARPYAYRAGPRYRGYDYRVAPRYRGNVYHYRRRCDAGTGGAVIGAIAGGLLGNTVAGRGDRTLGTVLGAVGGGVAGRAIDRADNPRRCR